MLKREKMFNRKNTNDSTEDTLGTEFKLLQSFKVVKVLRTAQQY